MEPAVVACPAEHAGVAVVVGVACQSEGMRFRYHDPDVRLRDQVRGYWEYEDFHLAGPELNYDLPERTLRLMFSAEPVLVGATLDALRPAPSVILTPFTLGAQRMVVQGQQRALAADLYPWGARQLLGWHAQAPPEALNEALSASAWGREVVALLRLREWDAARAALEAHLLARAGVQDEPGAGLHAAQQIYQASGVVRVAELAESLNVSARTLERQFAQQVGVGAKTLARVVRFDEAMTRIRADPNIPVAELTYQLGFFDQAHLIKEFKALSSMTPGTIAAITAQRLQEAQWRQVGDDQYVELRSRSDIEPAVPDPVHRF